MFNMVINSPIGKLGFEFTDESLTAVHFDVEAPVTPATTVLEKQVKMQINSYLSGKLAQFTLPIELSGTDFQKRVWLQLQKIPFGQTISYGDLAKKLDTSARAVGNACRKNPVPVIIPCHRVVAKQGIGGFSGQTEGLQIDRKRQLLKLESACL